ncbi:MAG: hypothetical protein IPN43_11390 [Chitinophagaceae bacterium]|nr:hypothetical protein [Chitinophagaceae bacterium]MBK8787066.1 hypothetical protein [Chitinophagaceae bacterium]
MTMIKNYRPPTIEERFFGHTTIVKVPVSMPRESLPETCITPLDSPPLIPDLTQSNHKPPIALSQVGTFLSKNWGFILAGAIFAGFAYWYYKKQKEKSKKSQAINMG